MSVLPIDRNVTTQSYHADKLSIRRVREEVRRQNVVTFILLVIFLFQLINLPGAIIRKSPLDIGTVMFGIALCGIAMMFNRMGKVNIVSFLLICIVDLGCGLMLLMSPMGLDVSELPIFDLLVVSELIAVSLMPAISIFPVAISNIVFIIAMLVLMPHTPELAMVLKSDMAYDAIAQPISLQIVVAAIAYIWVSAALRAAARADRAEEIAELQRNQAQLQQREIEQKRQLDMGIDELLHVLVRVSNGQTSLVSLSQENVLWRVGNSVNLLLTRLRRAQQVEQENQRLRAQNYQLMEKLHAAKGPGQEENNNSSQQNQPRHNSWPGI